MICNGCGENKILIGQSGLCYECSQKNNFVNVKHSYNTKLSHCPYCGKEIE
jgi:DNA-directed RNA polymerase subunit RPC12/RpoP